MKRIFYQTQNHEILEFVDFAEKSHSLYFENKFCLSKVNED